MRDVIAAADSASCAMARALRFMLSYAADAPFRARDAPPIRYDAAMDTYDVDDVSLLRDDDAACRRHAATTLTPAGCRFEELPRKMLL